MLNNQIYLNRTDMLPTRFGANLFLLFKNILFNGYLLQLEICLFNF